MREKIHEVPQINGTKGLNMITPVDLTEQEISDLKVLTNQNDAADAIRAAPREFLRHAGRMKLKQLSGRVEMLDNWKELEQAELDEIDQLQNG